MTEGREREREKRKGASERDERGENRNCKVVNDMIITNFAPIDRTRL